MQIDFHKAVANISAKTLRNRRKKLRKKMKKLQANSSNHHNVSAILMETAKAFDDIDIPPSQGVGSTSSNVELSEFPPVKKSVFPVPKPTSPTSETSRKRYLSESSSNENLTKKRKDDSEKESKIANNENNNKIVSSETTKARVEDLPVFKVKNEIMKFIRIEPTVIFIGDTGCGKSTQIPKYILEATSSRSNIIGVTQPRRVAAITIAEKVAEELGTPIGERVGYCVRFEDVTSPSTKIKYVTDGMLLRESISDPLLMKYGVVILDEAHERALHTDVLFGVVKKAQRIRRDRHLNHLKVVVMSATMDYNHFSKFFNDAPVYKLRGREYNITILNSLKCQDDYIHSALITVFKIHKEKESGDILVFSTGSEEIQSMVAEVSKATLELSKLGYSKLVPCALYAALPSKLQKQVFLPAPEGSRKVIFSTNIAETSVTIPGVKYVIDTGLVKARTFHSSSGFDILKIGKISKAQAQQRAGRAGREFNGFCYRLYTAEEFQNFKEFSIPEIQRCSLANVILQIVALGINCVKKFNFLDPPAEDNINSAITELKLLGALTENSSIDQCELSECGKLMVLFPLDPKFSKIIISSKKLRCLDEILTIVSLLSVESLTFVPSNEKDLVNKVWKKFVSKDGDHIMLLNMYKAFKSSRNAKEWCQENFMNYKGLKQVIAIRKQLSQICQRIDFPPKSCGSEFSLIRRCLVSGLFMNSAQLCNHVTYKTINANQKVQIHPSSCLFTSKPSLCIYTELVETSKCYMRNISTVEEDWLREAAPAFFKNKQFVPYQATSISH